MKRYTRSRKTAGARGTPEIRKAKVCNDFHESISTSACTSASEIHVSHTVSVGASRKILSSGGVTCELTGALAGSKYSGRNCSGFPSTNSLLPVIIFDLAEREGKLKQISKNCVQSKSQCHSISKTNVSPVGKTL